MIQDMLAEARREELEEHMLRTDFDYAIEKAFNNFELEEAYNKFKEASDWLSKYGHEMSPLDVFKEL